MKTAWVFPGQGSQAIGMGADLVDAPAAIARFEQAESILGWSVPHVCQSEDDKVSKTLYTQSCLYVIESILVDLLRQRGQEPSFVAGHSLGEYVALYAAEVLDFSTGLHLVKRRSELMDTASEGMMAALIGFDREQLEQSIAATDGVVLANDNNASQVVISGTKEGVEVVMAAVKTKRAVPLNVSGAFHSPLMTAAASEFQEVLESVIFQPAKVPVLSNVEPTPTTDADTLKQRLAQQMTGSVRWREISLQLSTEGVEKVTEVGPGKVLTGLVKRTCKEMALETVGTIADLDRLFPASA
ncbi:MAG: ACP S-malonyltransferase [Cyanobacteria bacterium J06638_22]